jgi:ABC-type uncharacterized transport system auxiliary subunit
MIKRFGVLLLLIMLAGCLGSTRPAPLVRLHVLDYPSPRMASVVAIGDVLLVERFSADRMAASREMIFSQGAYQQGVYQGHRWRVAPSDMATDFLRRDLRAAGLFKAVLTPRDLEETRFVLQGGVEVFGETGEGDTRKAVLASTVTLLDLSRGEIAGQVLFQESLRVEIPIRQPGAVGLAEAMSRAMPQFSQQVIAVIAAALKDQGR